MIINVQCEKTSIYIIHIYIYVYIYVYINENIYIYIYIYIKIRRININEILSMFWNRPPPIPSLEALHFLPNLSIRPKAPPRADEFPDPGLLGDDGVDTSLNQTFEAHLRQHRTGSGARVGCWAPHLILGTSRSCPRPQRIYQHPPKHGDRQVEEKHQKTCVTKLMEEAAFTLSKHIAFLTLTMDGLRKKALEKGRWLFLGSMFQSVNRFTLSCKALSFPNKLLIVTRVFLSYQFLLFLNVTH